MDFSSFYFEQNAEKLIQLYKLFSFWLEYIFYDNIMNIFNNNEITGDKNRFKETNNKNNNKIGISHKLYIII